MPYSYKISPTANPLSKDQLYEGLVVCFSDVQTNPNNAGVLEKRKNTGDTRFEWSAVINGVKHSFDLNGYDVNDNSIRLYGVLSDGDIDPTVQSAMTRSSTVQGESNTVSLYNMAPKDYFACEALNALIQRIDNPLSMSDGTIALLAAKSYKIAQAMAKEAYGSRENDKNSSTTGDYANINPVDLQDNKERVLYNISESLKEALNKGFAIKGETVPAGSTPTPIQTKVVEVTNIKKLEEITNIKKLDEITDVKKVTEVTDIKKLDEITNIKTIDELTEVTTIGEITEVKAIDKITDIKIIDKVTNVSALTISGTPNIKVVNTTSDPVNTKEVSTT